MIAKKKKKKNHGNAVEYMIPENNCASYRIYAPTCPERDKNLIFSPFFLRITIAKKHQSKSKAGGLAAPPATLDQNLKGSKLASGYLP